MAKVPKFLKYELDTKLLINRNTIWDFRKPKYVALVYAWLGGVRRILTDFLEYRVGIREYLKYNNQIIILQGMLNDYYDPTLRRIYISSEPAYVGYPTGILNAVEYSFPVGYPLIGGGTEPQTKSKVGYPNESGADGTIYLPADLGDDDFAKTVLSKVMDYAFFGVKITIIRF